MIRLTRSARATFGFRSNVRIYQFSSNQHGGFSPVAPLPTSTGICEQLPDANTYTYNIRALLVALEEWVAQGTLPPDNRYSRLDRGSLVTLRRVAFPNIPGVTGPAGIFNTRFAYYRGPQYDTDDLSGIIAVEPPIPLAEYPSLAPQVDADGNDIDGLRSHILQAPLGTYAGWNVRAAGFSQGDACDLTGSYIPFAVTKAQRLASGDPRLSLQERYGNTAGLRQRCHGGGEYPGQPTAHACFGRRRRHQQRDRLVYPGRGRDAAVRSQRTCPRPSRLGHVEVFHADIRHLHPRGSRICGSRLAGLGVAATVPECLGPHRAAHRTKRLVEWDAERLCLCVPHCDVDAGNRFHNYTTAPLSSACVTPRSSAGLLREPLYIFW